MKQQAFTFKKLSALSLCGVMCLSVCIGGGALSETRAWAEESALQQAVDAAADGATVTLTENCTDAITVGEDKNITIDLAGYEVSATLTNNGTLTLTDSEGTGAFRMTSSNGAISVIVNNGSLTVDGADIECTGTGSNTTVYGINNCAGATLTYLDGDAKAVSTGTNWGFAIQNSGTIAEIGGGTITSQIANSGSASNAIAINDSGSIAKITGGEITAEHAGSGYAAAIRLNANATIGEISGGTLTAKHAGTGAAEAVYVLANARLDKITGGTLSATVTNSSAGDKHLAFGLNNEGTVGEIGGGTIIGKSTATQWAFGITNVGTIEKISGGTFISLIEHDKNAPNAIALANTGTVGSISGGTFYASSTTASGITSGIRTQGAGTVNSFTGGAVYLSKPNDANYFLNVNGNMNYSAGYTLSSVSVETDYRYVMPSGGSYSEEIAEDDSTATATVYDADEQIVQTYTLYGVTRKDAAAIGEVRYASVTDAVAASAAGDTVVVLKDATEDITVPADKDVTIDLNGHEIVGTVVNRGALALTDTLGTGRLYKSTSADGLDPLIANYGTLVYGVTARIDGIGNGPQADGIYNYAGATLTVTGGRIDALSYGTKWSHGVVNEGTFAMTGGEIRSISFSAETASNIVALSNIGSGTVTHIGGGVLYAQTAGNGGSAVAVRTQATSVVENIDGGTVKAVVNSAANGTAAAYAIYLEGADTSVAVNGGTVNAVSYTGVAYAVRNKGTLSVGGGKISASAPHNAKESDELNIAAVLNEAGAQASVSGGFLTADSETALGATYAVSNSGNLTVSGGAFEVGKTESAYLFDADGTTNYADGVTLRSMQSATVKYAAAESDVIVEQLSGTQFVGVDVFRGGEPLYNYHEYEREGYYLSRFVSEGEGEMIKSEEFAALTQSATVYAEYERAPLYYFIGSSVTYGHANNGSSFVNEIASILNCVCVKEAISGTTLANNGSNSYVARMMSNLDQNAQVEHLIVQLSTNDVTQNVARGTISSTKNIEEIDNTTTLGAIEFIIAYAKMTWNCDVTFYTNPDYNNATYESLIEDLYKIQEKWGIGIVDFYHYTDMEELDPATLNSYMADAIHPNALGYRWMGEVFSDYLRELFSQQHDGAKI